MELVARTGEDFEVFRRLTTGYYGAWSTDGGTFDVARAERFYADDPELVFFDVLPPLDGHHGWASFRKVMVEQVYAKAADLKLRGNDDLRVWRSGSIAVTAQTFSGRVVAKDGAVTTFDGRNTDVWELRGADWQIVHEHGSVPFELR